MAQICLQCLNACGLLGYSNSSEFSVSRQLRDALGEPLMIANDRIKAGGFVPSFYGRGALLSQPLAPAQPNCRAK